ncbi:MAG: DUF814 domain-containing protein [Candidatus Latescibacteria bacterium]|nr:DUF814 domain-containing protein [Candidatus Latescibacterota bacterium]
MGFDFFTIHNLATELDAQLSGRRLLQAGSAEGELGLGAETGGHLYARLGREGWVCLRPGPVPEALESREGKERYLTGAQVEKIWVAPRDRLLWLRLSRTDSSGSPSYGRLVFELIHPRFQAYLISERSGLVLGGWCGARQGRLRVGQAYVPPPGPARLLPGKDTFGAFVDALPNGEFSPQSLARLLVGMDAVVAGQLLKMAGIESQELPDGEALRRLWMLAEDLYTRSPHQGGYVWCEGGVVQFSGLEPVSREGEVLPSISQAILRVKTAQSTSLPDGRELEKRLRQAQRVLGRRQRALKGDLAEADQAEDCEKRGNILLIHLGSVPTGAVSVELPDIYDASGSSRVTIELDPHSTAAENAAHLLRTARKYRQRRSVVPLLLRQVEKQLAEVESMLRGGEEHRAAGESWLAELGMNYLPGVRQGGEGSAHPRRYRTSTGWSVWAGRNNRENDLLSHRLAAQNDIWFHVHGYPGAHVVLRREGRKEEPSAQTLKEAASLAAYWSKGKTARKVPVVYTLVKYVSKPRGGIPGQALIKCEKTLMVEPGLLPEEKVSV